MEEFLVLEVNLSILPPSNQQRPDGLSKRHQVLLEFRAGRSYLKAFKQVEVKAFYVVLKKSNKRNFLKKKIFISKLLTTN